jgi:hypothetical protein
MPDLFLDENKRPLSLMEFKELLMETLHPEDLGLVQLLYLPYDNQNLLDYFIHKKEDLNPLGNYSLEEIQEQLSWLDAIYDAPGILPSYMKRFIEEYQADSGKRSYTGWEKYLTDLYYQHVLGTENPFLQHWFAFDLNLKNILTALNCREHGLEMKNQVVGDNEVASILQKDQGSDFGLSTEVEDIDYIIQSAEIENLVERELRIDKYRWDYLNENTFFEYFTVEKVIAYQLKLFMVSRWLELKKEAGEEMFRTLIDEMKEYYKDQEKEFKQ